MTYAFYFGETEASLTGVSRAPVDMVITLSDIDASDTGRPANGVMVRTVIRNGGEAVRSIELKWQNIPVTDAKPILTAIAGTFFFMKYQDPYTGDWRTAEFYASDRKVHYKRLKGDDATPFIAELSFSCVER